VAFGIFFAEGRKDDRADDREPDLAAMGVACEHEIDEVSAGMGDDVVGEVGRMSHEEHGTVRLFGDGGVEIGVTASGIVDAAEPEAATVAFNGEVGVGE
jgi:hypothetical protein